jgi:hypothetical protein
MVWIDVMDITEWSISGSKKKRLALASPARLTRDAKRKAPSMPGFKV